MIILTVTARDEIILPENVLNHLGIRPGDHVTVDKHPDGRIEIKAVGSGGQVSDVFNFLKRENAPSLSIGKINRITADAWAGKR